MLPRLQDVITDLKKTSRMDLGEQLVRVEDIVGSAETPELFDECWYPITDGRSDEVKRNYEQVFSWVSKKDSRETNYDWIHLYLVELSDGKKVYFVGADGNHRIAALKHLKRKRVLAFVVKIVPEEEGIVKSSKDLKVSEC